MCHSRGRGGVASGSRAGAGKNRGDKHAFSRSHPHISAMPKISVVAIDAPHFCAGLVLENDLVIRAAPILRYMVGWRRERVMAYARRKGWQAWARNCF